ncbi:MAG: DUF2905 family protein [Candidatus Eisenbacteria bacterium]|nr:DUF2905 family protein [Candidatus Latescibacterota bacterium]MBD3300898.1 DUF2905 family protein [Candidatus Eisenbacteria bacterium]
MERVLGRVLLLFGLGIAALGLLLLVAPKIPFLGRLPGDLRFQRDGTTIFLPLATCLLLSILLTVILNLLGRR